MANDDPYSAFNLMIRGMNKLNNAIDKHNVKVANQTNRGVVDTKSSIDALSSECAFNNYLLTGGDQRIRWRIIASACAHALHAGRIPIILHPHNMGLCDIIDLGFNGEVVHLSQNEVQYDPFDGYASYEVPSRIVDSSSSLGNSCVSDAGGSYLRDMIDLMESCGKLVRIDTLRKFPHSARADFAMQYVNRGILSQYDARRIIGNMDLFQNQAPFLINWIDRLYTEGRSMVWEGKTRDHGSIRSLSGRNRPITVDISNYRSTVLLGCILDEITRGQKTSFTVIFDSLMDGTGQLFVDYLHRTSPDYSTIVSTDDIIASVDANENVLRALMRSSKGMAVMRHRSPASCQILSQMMGTYQKTEISESRTFNWGGAGGMTSGVTKTNVTVPRIRPEVIESLPNDMALVIAGNGGIQKMKLRIE